MNLHSDITALAVKDDRPYLDWPGDNPAEILLPVPALKTPLARGTMRGALAVLGLVGAEYSATVEELRGKDRHRTIAEARKVAYYLLRETRRFSYPEIGIVLDRDHTTVMSGVRNIAKRVKSDERLRATIERLLAELEPMPRVEGFESGRFG